MILYGWLGLKHQLTNKILSSLSLQFQEKSIKKSENNCPAT